MTSLLLILTAIHQHPSPYVAVVQMYVTIYLAKFLSRAFLEKSIEPKLLHYLPEKDEWQYPTLRNGNPFTSDVSICNVFACKVWRAAGVFDSMEQDFACGEFSVSDNYR